AAEPGGPEPHVGRAAHRARGERGVETREGKELQEERFGHGRRVGRFRIECPQSGEQEDRELDVPFVFLRDLVDGLEHRLAGREQAQVVADVPVRGDDLRLGDGVERAATPVEHQVDVGERLEPSAEPRGGLPDALGDAADLARTLGQDGDDLVGFAEFDRAQDDPLLLIGGHGRMVAPEVLREPCSECGVSVAAEGGQAPIGCQTVLNSTKAVISDRCCPAAPARCTRLTLSAAARSASATSSSGQPVRSIPFTSIWAASHGTSALGNPVKTLITTPGTSEVASASASETAGSGERSLATATATFPETITGAIRLTNPSNAGSVGATIPTTPVGSGMVKLKYGPATGFALPATWAILSAHPAYQTHRSIARLTSPAGSPAPESRSSSSSCARRPSMISATRYRIWPRL